jgi:hypothetical protein
VTRCGIYPTWILYSTLHDAAGFIQAIHQLYYKKRNKKEREEQNFGRKLDSKKKIEESKRIETSKKIQRTTCE